MTGKKSDTATREQQFAQFFTSEDSSSKDASKIHTAMCSVVCKLSGGRKKFAPVEFKGKVPPGRECQMCFRMEA